MQSEICSTAIMRRLARQNRIQKNYKGTKRRLRSLCYAGCPWESRRSAFHTGAIGEVGKSEIIQAGTNYCLIGFRVLFRQRCCIRRQFLHLKNLVNAKGTLYRQVECRVFHRFQYRAFQRCSYEYYSPSRLCLALHIPAASYHLHSIFVMLHRPLPDIRIQ